MSTDISNSFVKEYAALVHIAYQQKASKLKKTVRFKGGVRAKDVTFQKAGKGMAVQKPRHGKLSMMDISHGNATAILEDWYAPDKVDKLDELAINHDEKLVLAESGAGALGRKVDDLITTELDKTSVIIPHGDAGLTKHKVLQAFGLLNAADVPDDGNRFAVVGANQWNELLNISEFKSSDYVGDKYAWLNGTEAKKWLGVVWMFHSGLPVDNGNRKCFMYHKSAVGYAEAADITPKIDWLPEEVCHLINHWFKAGACLIDSTGVIEIQCDDDAAIA